MRRPSVLLDHHTPSSGLQQSLSDGRNANEMKREKQIWTIAATK